MNLPDYDDLDPGIRDLVRTLNEHGFETRDSGDGVSKVGGPMDDGLCVQPFPHVVIQSSPEKLIADAQAVYALLVRLGYAMGACGYGPSASASYDPADGSCVVYVDLSPPGDPQEGP